MSTRRGFVIGAGVLLARPAWSADDTPRRGGTLIGTWGGFEPQALFVPAGGGSSPELSSSKILERLIAFSNDFDVIPLLAESWTHSADFTQYTINLRQGVSWHDGTAFTADDVVFSALDYWKVISAPLALKNLTTAEAIGDHQVVLRFSQPVPERFFAGLLAGQSGAVLPRHLYARGDIITNPVNNTPIGTGPWKYKQWNRGSYIAYERFSGYWNKGLPYPDQLILRYFRDSGARAAAMEAGELQIGVFNPLAAPDLKRLTATGNFTATTKGYEDALWQTTLEMNMRNPITAKREVRQAIHHAIDRRFIAETIFFGYAKPSIGAISQNNKLYFTGAAPSYPFDPKQAEAMLDAAGHPRRSDGRRFRVTLVAAGWFSENGKIGAYIQQVLGDVGIDVTLVVPDRPTSLKRIYTDYDYDLAISNNSNPAEPVPYATQYFATEGIVKGAAFRNATGFSSPAMDRLVADITIEIDPEKRKKLIGDFNVLAATEVPIAPLVDLDTVTLAGRRVYNHSNRANFLGAGWTDIWLAS